MYVNALKPASILSLSLQEGGVDIVHGLQYTLTAAHSLQSLTKQDTTHDAHKWPNLVLLSELLFSLPFTNAKAERTSSNLTVIKNERHTSLLSTTLDDQGQIKSLGKYYRPRVNAEDSTSDQVQAALDLFRFEDWDDWFKVANSNSD